MITIRPVRFLCALLLGALVLGAALAAPGAAAAATGDVAGEVGGDAGGDAGGGTVQELAAARSCSQLQQDHNNNMNKATEAHVAGKHAKELEYLENAKFAYNAAVVKGCDWAK
jgi:hypothetical protein